MPEIQINRSKTVKIHPRFSHNCDECVWIGTVEINERVSDIYFHKYGIAVTIIARFSSEDNDYTASNVENISVFSSFLLAGFSMYLDHIGARSFNGRSNTVGNFYDNEGKCILSV